jgi:pyruvate dehydrogenase E1 component beta subunit
MSAVATRTVTYAEALRDALELALERDPSVYVLGLGVPDPKAIFGSTAGLQERFGEDRVMDMPAAENGMTGVALGTALGGMRPVMVHQRIDFALLAVEQLVNQAAKWHYMFDGRMRVPLVVRMLVGRGWGQGPQHSQSLHSWFAHIPGLKVVMPVTPADAKGMLLAAIEDDNPVVFIEHRWLHNGTGEVPEGWYTTPIGPARIAREGSDVTVLASSYMVVEALTAATALAGAGVDVEVVDVRSLRPLDTETIVASAAKTGRVLVADSSWETAGFSGELAAVVAEHAFDRLVTAPKRLAMPEVPVPTARALSRFSYPRAADVVAGVAAIVGLDDPPAVPDPEHLDVPDASFTGPF